MASLAYDEFAEHVITTKALPWGGAAVDGWGDEHDTRACEWMQEQGIPASLGIVGRAVQAVAGQNGVHPVRDFLNNLKWDGTARIESWLTTYLGAEDSVYVRAVGPRIPSSPPLPGYWFLGAKSTICLSSKAIRGFRSLPR